MLYRLHQLERTSARSLGRLPASTAAITVPDPDGACIGYSAPTPPTSRPSPPLSATSPPSSTPSPPQSTSLARVSGDAVTWARAVLGTAAARTQVFISYGKKSSAELLLLYGFVPNEGTNPNDSVELLVSLDKSDKCYKEKLPALKRNGQSGSQGGQLS